MYLSYGKINRIYWLLGSKKRGLSMRKMKKALALVLALCMIFTAVQSAGAAGTNEVVSEISFSVISDIHYYPSTLYGEDNTAFDEYCSNNSKQYAQSEQITIEALKRVAERAQAQGTEYLLIPGDLTKDSEYEAHVRLAEVLLDFEEETGISVIVTNGNHDIGNNKSCTFINGSQEEARCITQAEFAEVYKDLGFDLADTVYQPAQGTTDCLLSYTVDMGDYRLIVLDSSIYNPYEADKNETGGRFTPELMAWVEQQAANAKAQDETPVVMMHHNLAPHMKCEPSVTFAFCIDDYLSIAEKFADWGINYAFTGHLHTADTAYVVNDNGNVLYDIETPSMTGFPNQYREVVLSTDADGVSSLYTDVVDVDEDATITIDGEEYTNGEYKSTSFALSYGGLRSEDGSPDCAGFLEGIVLTYGAGFIDDIAEAGGLLSYLETMGIDLRDIIGGFLEPLIGDGIGIGGYNIFSVENIMWFIEDLCSQIDELYIKNPDVLWALVGDIIRELCALQVSDVPCTKFIDTLGFGDASRGGTFGEVILSAVYYWAVGNENIYDEADPDLFMQDACKQLREGDFVNRLFNFLMDTVFNDILDEALLSKLEIRLDKLLGDSVVAKNLGDGINYLLNYVLRGDFTYQNLIDTFFALEILPYTSLFDTLDQLLIKEYITDSLLEGIGYMAAAFVEDFSTDANPAEKSDFGVSYASTKVVPDVTAENYRKPTLINVTMGADSQNSANLNWYSKYTLPETDIEIYAAADGEVYTADDFTGVPTLSADFTIEKSEELVERNYPGIDIGFAGLFKYYFNVYRHVVTLTNLTPGTTYYYRVGNAARGWWSDVGSITTADGSDNVTFFHMADQQSINEYQHEKSWANVAEKAFELYPDADFVVNTGDMSDHGDNINLWRYFFDTASKQIMNTFMMPTSGNHEAMGAYSTTNYFTLPNVPEQNLEDGVYYSYTYNNVLVMVLNTNDNTAADEALGEKQIEWLKNTANNSDAEWKIVALHKALYSNGSHYDDDDVCAMRAQLSALLPELDVDLVLQGHDHVYLRTYSLDSNEVAYTEYNYLIHDDAVYKTQVLPTGTTYAITGTAGVKTYLTKDIAQTDELFPRAHKIYDSTAQMFAAVEIEDGILYFTAYAVDGEDVKAVDRFAIQKDKAQGIVAEGYVDEEENTQQDDSFFGLFAQIFEIILKILTVLLNIYKLYF